MYHMRRLTFGLPTMIEPIPKDSFDFLEEDLDWDEEDLDFSESDETQAANEDFDDEDLDDDLGLSLGLPH